MRSEMQNEAHSKTGGEALFASAEEALKWAVEVLRRRRLPRTAGFWREIEAEAEWAEQVWEGTKNLSLPQTADERMELALKVMEGLQALVDKDVARGRLLQLWAWGDWADEGRLAAALAIQEKCRREGVRVRLAYRYSYAQLGVVMRCDKKVAWRRVQEGLAALGDILAGQGLMVMAGELGQEVNNFKKDVYLYDFKNVNE